MTKREARRLMIMVHAYGKRMAAHVEGLSDLEALMKARAGALYEGIQTLVDDLTDKTADDIHGYKRLGTS